jgi:trigger factor
MRAKKNLLDVLDKEHDFDVPPGMLEMEYDSIIKQIEQEQAQQNPGETVEVSDEDKEEFKTIAVRRVKLGLVLSEIGRENNIEVSQADLQKAVIEQAQKYPGQEKEVFDFYSKNQDALNSLRAPLFEEKTVDFIFELATVTEVEMSPEDLTKDDDEEDAPKAKKPAAKKKAPAKKKAAAKKDD